MTPARVAAVAGIAVGDRARGGGEFSFEFAGGGSKPDPLSNPNPITLLSRPSNA
jgi:hypothetical protein